LYRAERSRVSALLPRARLAGATGAQGRSENPADGPGQLVRAVARLGRRRRDKVMAYLANRPQTADVVKRRAEMLQAAGRNVESATLWERHYQQTGNLNSVNQASYLVLDAGQRDHARQILENASRASSLPHLIGVVHRICVQQQSIWERCSRRGRQPQRKIIRPRASKRPASPVALQPT
jgi:hypothetical protein